MKKAVIFLGVLLLVFCLINNTYADKSNVRIENNKLLVSKRLSDGTLDKELPYTIKLINWSPCQIGDNNGDRYLENYTIDIPLIKEMNANTVRIFDVIDSSSSLPPGSYIDTAILDELYENGIMVIITAVWDHNIKNETYIKNVVRNFRDHPAVLGWSLGNEWNLWSELGRLYYDAFADPGALNAAINATEQAAIWIKEAYQEAGLDPVPVVSSLVYYWDEDPDMGWEPFSYYENIVNSCPNVDAYGINMYQEPTKYVQLAREWANAGFQQPLFIGEFGTDSYNTIAGAEDQSLQATFNELIYRTLKDYFSAYDSDNALIGCGAFEFNDEWWKMGNPTSQSTLGGTDPDVIDGYRSEEWMGVVEIDRNLKESYHELAKIYPLREYLNLGGNITLKAKSSTNQATALTSFAKFYIDDQPYWRPITDKYDPRARGMNILVLDAQNLRVLDAENFDTYEYSIPGGGANEVAMRNFLSNIANDSLVLIAASDTATYWEGPAFAESTYQLFESFGSTKIRNLGFREAYAFILKKNLNATFTPIAEECNGTNTVTAQGITAIDDNFIINCDISNAISADSANTRAAAGIEAQLRYTQQATSYTIPSQAELHNLAKSNNLPENAGEDFVDPIGLKTALNLNQHPFYNFEADTYDQQDDAIASICSWMTFTVSREGPQHIPAFFPAYGSYDNWMVVRGLHSDVDPQEDDQYTVKSFWIRDYSIDPSHLGANVYVSANDFKNIYLLPLDTPNNDTYEGKYVVIVEPPFDINTNFKIYQYESRFADSLNNIDLTFNEILSKDISLTNQANITIKESKAKRKTKFFVEGEEDAYWLFPIFENDNYPKTRSMLAVNVDGRFKAISWTDSPITALTVSKNKARRIIRYRLRERPKSEDLSLFRLKHDNIFRPSWKYIAEDDSIYYITQDKDLILANSNSKFINQSIPLDMIAGQTYKVSITMQNIGETTWTKDNNYMLKLKDFWGSVIWKGSRVKLSKDDSIDSQDTKTFTFKLRAPNKPGKYTLQWQMVKGRNGWFGEPTKSIIINVNGSFF